MYYIDFDNTIYETGRLTKDILTTFARVIAKSKKLNPNLVLDELKNSFNSTVDNFESFASGLSARYDINNDILQSHLKKIILTEGKSYVFPDALQFLKKLKEEGEYVCILTYVAQRNNLNQQALKLAGSGILKYINEVYNTTRYKFELEIDYESGIFIDDSPRDIEGLYKAGARKIIRIKKPNNVKRTSKELNLPIEIPTYTSFNDIITEKSK